MTATSSARDLDADPWFPWAITSLRFAGAAYVLLGVASAALIPIVELGDLPAERQALGFVATALCLGIPTVLIGVANFTCARALQQRKPWGFIGGLIFGALYAPSACLPFGAVILYALLRPGVKNAYDAGPSVQ